MAGIRTGQAFYANTLIVNLYSSFTGTAEMQASKGF